MEFLDAFDSFLNSPIDRLLDPDTEVWMTVTDYPNYSVSTRGRVKNNKTGRILKPSITSCGYYRIELSRNGKANMFLVHRLVAQAFLPNPDKKRYVDHINNDRLHNHLSNLRWATRSENSRNSKTPKSNTSGYKGVYFNKRMKKFHAQIYLNQKNNHLGCYDTVEEAAQAYNDAAIKHYGDFAKLNEIK